VNTYWPVVLRITITIRSPSTTSRARDPTVTDVNPRQSFEWDVLQHPDLTSWFDMLRDAGWYRDPDVPGVKTPTGTFVYTFRYLAADEELGA
jgi:hypothetical protein